MSLLLWDFKELNFFTQVVFPLFHEWVYLFMKKFWQFKIEIRCIGTKMIRIISSTEGGCLKTGLNLGYASILKLSFWSRTMVWHELWWNGKWNLWVLLSPQQTSSLVLFGLAVNSSFVLNAIKAIDKVERIN